jgi:hypothetical protein
MEIIRAYGDHCLLTYLHWKQRRPEEAGIVRCVECMSPPSPSELGPDDRKGWDLMNPIWYEMFISL